jgi:hypothetical protein
MAFVVLRSVRDHVAADAGEAPVPNVARLVAATAAARLHRARRGFIRDVSL